MSDSEYSTQQEDFWAGDFGNDYVARNQGPALLAQVTHHWSTILRACTPVTSILELGANIGLNMHALRRLVPQAKLAAVEINETAHEKLSQIDGVEAIHDSLLDLKIDRQFDLTFTSGVLINIAPDALPQAYERLYECSRRFIVVIEYYSPSPVEIPYRGHGARLYKRDFAGDLLDRYADLELRDYGFFYRRDAHFPTDDANWFLLEKRSAE